MFIIVISGIFNVAIILLFITHIDIFIVTFFAVDCNMYFRREESHDGILWKIP